MLIVGLLDFLSLLFKKGWLKKLQNIIAAVSWGFHGILGG